MWMLVSFSVLKRGFWYYHLYHDEVTTDVDFAMHQLLRLLVHVSQRGQLMIRKYLLYHKGACD